jgi:hypothetical protein
VKALQIDFVLLDEVMSILDIPSLLLLDALVSARKDSFSMKT